MAQQLTYVPEQNRYLDPHDQRLTIFGPDSDPQDPRVYVSKALNNLLKSIGKDVVIRGLDIDEVITDDEGIFTIYLKPGIIIQDSVLIEIHERTELTINVTPYDDCNGYLIIYTSYQHYETLNENPLTVKISYIDEFGMIREPGSLPWNHNRDRIILHLIAFGKPEGEPVTHSRILYPRYFFAGGSRYWLRGIGGLNFDPIDRIEIQPDPFYYRIELLEDSYLAPVQLFDEDLVTKRINNLRYLSPRIIELSIDEYLPIDNDGYYLLLVADHNDMVVHELPISDIDSVTGKATINHNQNTTALIIKIYDDEGYLVRARNVKFTDSDNVEIDLSNRLSNLAAQHYKIVFLFNNTYQTPFNLNENPNILIDHNRSKTYQITQIERTNLYNSHNVVQLYSNEQFNIFHNCNINNKVYYNVNHFDNIRHIYKLLPNRTVEYYHSTLLISITQDDLDINNSITITHNFNYKYPLVFVYDNNNKQYILSVVTFINSSNILINYSPDYTIVGTHTIIIHNYQPSLFEVNNINTITIEKDYKSHLLQCINENDELIIPESIIIDTTTNDNINITFADLVNNHKVVTHSGIRTYYERFNTSSNNYTVNHELGHILPLTHFYKNNEFIFPESVQGIDEDNVLISFNDEDNTIDYDIVCVELVMQRPVTIYKDYSAIVTFVQFNLDSENKIIIEHGLNDGNVLVQVYDNDGYMIEVENIQVIDYNNIIIWMGSVIASESYKAVIHVAH